MLDQPWLRGDQWRRTDPRISELESCPLRLSHLDDVLRQIPLSEGIFSILGPRQVGKSTLLHLLAIEILKTLPPAAVALVEGDAIESWREILSLLTDYLDRIPPGRIRAALLIDEITSVPEWHRAVKLLADRGTLKGVLLVYTGSSSRLNRFSRSLKEGGEFLPGRRGRHPITNFEVAPASYRHVASRLSLETYFKVGGFPWAVNEYLRLKSIPPHVGEIYWGWLKGEFLKRGKSDLLLRHLVQSLVRRVGTPFSHNKLAQETGIASHETARQYLELLQDCYAVNELFWIDPSRHLIAPRKNRKYYPVDPFLYHLFRESGLSPWNEAPLSSTEEGKLAELVVCQELRQRAPNRSDLLGYWSAQREIDFMTSPPRTGKAGCIGSNRGANPDSPPDTPHRDNISSKCGIEVKYQNRVIPGEFQWFEKSFPKDDLLILTKNDSFSLGRIRAMPLKTWLLASD